MSIVTWRRRHRVGEYSEMPTLCVIPPPFVSLAKVAVLDRYTSPWLTLVWRLFSRCKEHSAVLRTILCSCHMLYKFHVVCFMICTMWQLASIKSIVCCTRQPYIWIALNVHCSMSVLYLILCYISQSSCGKIVILGLPISSRWRNISITIS